MYNQFLTGVFDSWIDKDALRDHIGMILLSAIEYGLSSREIAYVLSTAYGECRFGAITEGFFANDEHILIKIRVSYLGWTEVR